MFWSGNYIAVRELNFLLKEENVSLTQVLEADDILQECKADNKALIQFLTKPEVLAELITLITEEPPKNVELASQYRHASIACEVLTSHLSTLADRLSLDTVQMNRLCDFINKEPPLNPLLASYFSKTVEMLLERSPKQDWYLYHIVCLRVLDFFRSRRDFLPNLLRHIATSAIADTFKALLRLDDLFNKLVMEWLDEHQFLESLIAIICGSYVPEPIRPAAAPAPHDGTAPQDGAAPDGKGETEKAEAEISEKTDANHKDEDGVKEEKPVENSVPPEVKSITITTRDSIDGETDVAASRWRAVAAANAASLLCDLVLNGCAGDHCTARLRTVWVLVSRLQSEEWVRALLGGMFTSPASARQQALVHGCQVLLALLSTDPILAGQCAAERTSVELAVAPHLPLLHQTLLQDYTVNTISNDHDGGGGNDSTPKSRVGAARVHVAALLAQLALSEVEDVPTTMITLGTPGTLVDLFFKYPDNNFLHAQVYAFIKHSLNNRAYRTQYANHLLVECDLLNRLMDVFEENENKRTGVPRAGYMGHVILALRRAARALSEQDNELLQQLRLPESTKERWTHFTQNQLQYAAQQHDTPLGGYYPSENIYEVENMADLGVEASYEFNDISGNELGEDLHIDAAQDFGESTEGGDGRQQSSEGMVSNAKNAFLELAGQRFDEDMWDDSPEDDTEEEPRLSAGAVPAHDVEDVLSAVAPWETPSADGGSAADDDWAQFSAAPAPPPIDPFAPLTPLTAPSDLTQEFTPFWPSSNDTSDIPDAIMQLSKFSISATFPEEINEPANPVENPIDVAKNPVELNNPVANACDPFENPSKPVENPSNPIENFTNLVENPINLVNNASNPVENPIKTVEQPSKQVEEKLDNVIKDVDNRQIVVENNEVNVNNIDKNVVANKLDVDNDNIKSDTAGTAKCETPAIEVNEACSDS